MTATVAARVAVAGATVGDAVAVAVFVGRSASEIAVALCGTAVGSDIFVAAAAGLVPVAVGRVDGAALQRRYLLVRRNWHAAGEEEQQTE